MKFGTWSSNRSALRRNLTRFWPAWAGFTLVLLLSLLAARNQLPDQLWMRFDLPYWFTAAYGLLCALLVFGDQFVPRYAASVHSLPVTRQGLFLGNLLSGLALAVLPVAIALVLTLLTLGFGPDPFIWAAALLSWFVYGFSLGALSAVLAGTRFGALAFSLLLAFGVPLAEVLYQTIAQTLLRGVILIRAYSRVLSPLLWLLDCGYPDFWGYQAVVLAVCLVVLGLSMWLYTRRKTERAGDFMAFTGAKPVMKLAITCLMGVPLGLLLSSMLNLYGVAQPWQALCWLLPGVLVARVVAEMMVERTVRVLKQRNLAHYGLCLVVCILLVGVIWLDPVGLETYVPKTEDVAECRVVCSGAEYSAPNVADPAYIQKALELHQTVLDHPDAEAPDGLYNSRLHWLRFEYTLKDGTPVERAYNLQYIPEPELLEEFVSLPENRLTALLDYPVTFREFRDGIREATLWDRKNDTTLNRDQALALADALWQDLEEGSLDAQQVQWNSESIRISFVWTPSYYSTGDSTCTHIFITPACANTWSLAQELLTNAP